MPLVKSMGGIPTHIVCDRHSEDAPSPWRTYRRCLEWALRGTGTHLLVIQDDAVVCPAFNHEIRAAITERPESLLSLYTGRYPEHTAIAAVQAVEAGERWAQHVMGHYVAAVALVWPRILIQGCLDFVDAARWYTPALADDEVIGRWVTATNLPVWHRVPNLVDHPDDVESLMGSRKRNRHSCVPWGGENLTRAAR